MKRRVFSAFLSVVLAMQPCMAGFAQGERGSTEEVRLEGSQEVQDAGMAEEETVCQEAEEGLEKQLPAEPDAGWMQVNQELPEVQAEWNLVDEEEKPEETGDAERIQEAGAADTMAADTESVTGTYGDNVTYSLDLSTGTLTFRGSGDMADSSGSSSDSPFSSYRDRITSVEIAEGITSVGNYAFYRCTKLRTVSMPGSVRRIGSSAFRGCEKLEQAENELATLEEQMEQNG